MSLHNIPSRRIRLVAVIAAGVTVGIGAAFVASAANTPDVHDPTYGRSVPPELVQYAEEHGLSGLSPASLQPTSVAAELRAIEEYARTSGLTGLSPASLHDATPTP